MTDSKSIEISGVKVLAIVGAFLFAWLLLITHDDAQRAKSNACTAEAEATE